MGKSLKKYTSYGSSKKWKKRKNKQYRNEVKNITIKINKTVKQENMFDHWTEETVSKKYKATDLEKPYDGAKKLTKKYENIVHTYFRNILHGEIFCCKVRDGDFVDAIEVESLM